MKKNCSRNLPVSRADTGTSMSSRPGYRNSEFRVGNVAMQTDGTDEVGDGVFLMNRFYGETIIRPMIECVKQEFAGDIGLLVANRLEKEMQEKNGCIRGDELLDLLKEELGLECAVSMIVQMDRFRKMGLYGDRIVTRLAEMPVAGADASGIPAKKRIRKRVKGDCGSRKDEDAGPCLECGRKKTGKEKADCKTNVKTK